MEHLKKNLVINWHLLEPCQLKCKYCYAEWGKTELKQIFKDEELSYQLIQEIATLADNRTIRLSFAGGEPLLDNQISKKIQWAVDESLNVSLITNGDFLKKKINHHDIRNLSMLGVSIDSFCNRKNTLIGRATLSGRNPNYEEIVNFLNNAKKINPTIQIKINTVINRFNFDDDMSEMINLIEPDKWKVLRVLPATEKSSKEKITDEQFAQFKQNHKDIDCVQFEDNTDMLHSYLMIDPYGRFFFNASNDYKYSDCILDVGIIKAMKQIKFDRHKFESRYTGCVK